jgi:hypothetical protein
VAAEQLGQAWRQAIEAADTGGDPKPEHDLRHQILRTPAATLAGLQLKAEAFLFNFAGIATAESRLAELEGRPLEASEGFEHFAFSIARDLVTARWR